MKKDNFKNMDEQSKLENESTISLEESLKDNIVDFLINNEMNIREVEEDASRRRKLAKEAYSKRKEELLEYEEYTISNENIIDEQGYLKDHIDDRIFEEAQDEFEVDKYDSILDDYNELSLLASQPDYQDTPKAPEFLREVEFVNQFEMTNDLDQSLWITPNNQLISSYGENGIRSIDHRALLDFYNLDREDIESWDKIHEMGYVRIVPETEYALIYENQPLTDEQIETIKNYDYQMESYGVIKDENELEEEAYYDLLDQYAEDYLINNKDDTAKYITVIGVKDSEIAFTSNLKEFEDEYHEQDVDHYLMLHHNKNVYSIKEKEQYEQDMQDNPLPKKYEALLKQTRVGSLRQYDLEEQTQMKQNTLE